MQHLTLLEDLLTKSQAIEHKKRTESVLKAVDSLVHGGKLSLTSIGRNRQDMIQPRSKIQSTNYLLGNYKLNGEVDNIYKAHAQSVLGSPKEIDILIDWSTLISGECHLLRASIVCRGRSMTLYDEIHPESLLGNSEVQGKFLQRLKAILGNDIKATIISDAGFKTDFFEQAKLNGFEHLGRVLSNMKYRRKGSDTWDNCSDVHNAATSQAQAIGEVELSKSRALPTYLYLNKEVKKADKKTPKKRTNKDKSYADKAQKPWLIASSLKVDKAQKIMNRYARRMKIEHEFRDTKDERWGLGFRFSRTRNIDRLRILIMLSVLAIWLLWIIGMATEAKNFHRHFQANSIKNKRILSLVFLGREVIKSHYLDLLGVLSVPSFDEEDCVLI